jgi:hypothetical protein
VPLQAIALNALEQRPSGAGTDLLFPSLRGAYFDLHNFRTREWKPAQLAAGITPIRRVYDLRHTFATFALRAGEPDHQTAERPEQEPTPRIQGDGRTTLRSAHASPDRNRVSAPHRLPVSLKRPSKRLGRFRDSW